MKREETKSEFLPYHSQVRVEEKEMIALFFEIVFLTWMIRGIRSILRSTRENIRNIRRGE
jgi:hypothetical protein